MIGLGFAVFLFHAPLAPSADPFELPSVVYTETDSQLGAELWANLESLEIHHVPGLYHAQHGPDSNPEDGWPFTDEMREILEGQVNAHIPFDENMMFSDREDWTPFWKMQNDLTLSQMQQIKSYIYAYSQVIGDARPLTSVGLWRVPDTPVKHPLAINDEWRERQDRLRDVVLALPRAWLFVECHPTGNGIEEEREWLEELIAYVETWNRPFFCTVGVVTTNNGIREVLPVEYMREYVRAIHEFNADGVFLFQVYREGAAAGGQAFSAEKAAEVNAVATSMMVLARNLWSQE